MRSGQTPTENTGPSYDHTSFNKDGKIMDYYSSVGEEVITNSAFH